MNKGKNRGRGLKILSLNYKKPAVSNANRGSCRVAVIREMAQVAPGPWEKNGPAFRLCDVPLESETAPGSSFPPALFPKPGLPEPPASPYSHLGLNLIQCLEAGPLETSVTVEGGKDYLSADTSSLISQTKELGVRWRCWCRTGLWLSSLDSGQCSLQHAALTLILHQVLETFGEAQVSLQVDLFCSGKSF